MDLIRMAMEEAARGYGGPFDNGTFNAANFSGAMLELGMATAALDGNVVREILKGRDDVLRIGLSYYQIKDYTQSK